VPAGRIDATPSTVMTSSPPASVSEIECSAAPDCALTTILQGELDAAALNEALPGVEVDADASSAEAALPKLASFVVAGGDGPLPGTAAGSSGGSVALVSIERPSAVPVSVVAAEAEAAVCDVCVAPPAVAVPAPANCESPPESAGAAAIPLSFGPLTDTLDVSGVATAGPPLETVVVVVVVADSDSAGASATGSVGATSSVEAATLSCALDGWTEPVVLDGVTVGASMSAAPLLAIVCAPSGPARAAASALRGVPVTAAASASPRAATPGGSPAEMRSIPV
jgi:hypothetical protein